MRNGNNNQDLAARLRPWVRRFAVDIRSQVEGSEDLTARAQALRAEERVSENFTSWVDRLARRNAISLVLRTFYLAVLEDYGVVRMQRLRDPSSRQLWNQLTRNLGGGDYLRWCFREWAQILPDLFDDPDSDLATPADEVVDEFLDSWRADVPGHIELSSPGRPFDHRIIGDLYEHLDEEIRKRYALCQTPEPVEQFILKYTLEECLQEKDAKGEEWQETTLLDPACGSGHFLLGAFRIFWDRYQQDPRTRDLTPEETYRRVVENHLFGADINDYACSLARFRLILEGLERLGAGVPGNGRRLSETDVLALRTVRFNVVCCDSLIRWEDPGFRDRLPYEFLEEERERGLSVIEASRRARRDYRRVLGNVRDGKCRHHDVVVGNPPYIIEKDALKRELYRTGRINGVEVQTAYVAAYQKFSLVAPFTERAFALARSAGRIGLINSNAFVKRLFGKKLIESVLACKDMTGVVDLEGINLPGHGTPTLIVFAVNRRRSSDTVRVVSRKRGYLRHEEDIISNPYWGSVVLAWERGSYEDQFVHATEREASSLAQHPWVLSDRPQQLLQRLGENAQGRSVSQFSASIGIMSVNGQDAVFEWTASAWRRTGLDVEHARPWVEGDAVRDWLCSNDALVVFPYCGDRLADEVENSRLFRFLRRYRKKLETRKTFGVPILQAGLRWYEFQELYKRKLTPPSIVFPFVATHNHFVVEPGPSIFKQTAPIIKLRDNAQDNDYKWLIGVLNSSTVCFSLKQRCFNKRSGDNPVRDTFYEFDGTKVGQTPLPVHTPDTSSAAARRVRTLADECHVEARRLGTLTMRGVFEQPDEAYHGWYTQIPGYVEQDAQVIGAPYKSVTELRVARDRVMAEKQRIRNRMVWLQEEMDWVVYGMYGLLRDQDGPVLATDYMTAREIERAECELGERPFEIAFTQDEANEAERDEKTDQFLTTDGAPMAESIPDRFCTNMKKLWEARMRVLKENEDIALIEQALYKRRWVPPDYEAEFREACQWWLREKAEYFIEQRGKQTPCRPTSLDHLCSLTDPRSLRNDPRVLAALEVYCGSDSYDFRETLRGIMDAEALPHLPEHYLTDEGLRKLEAWQRMWDLQKREDAGEEVGPIEVAPEFDSKDFRKGEYWKLRGKLNVPRERFVRYDELSEMENTTSDWYGWPGWDAVQQAEALAVLLDEMTHAGRTREEKTDLARSLYALLPQLGEQLNKGEVAEFRDVALANGLLTEEGRPAEEYLRWRREHTYRTLTRRTRQPAAAPREAADAGSSKASAVAPALLTAVQAAIETNLGGEQTLWGEDEGVSLEALEKHLGQPKEELQKALRVLKSEGKVATRGRGRGTRYVMGDGKA